MELTPRIPSPSSGVASSELEIRIRKRFANPEGSFLLNVHFRAVAGITILFGASGAGKTTLLDCVAGLSEPDEGFILLGGSPVYSSASKLNQPPWQRRTGYVLQDLALFPHLTAEANVAYGLHRFSAEDRRRRSLEALESFRIGHVRDRYPDQISGGERQRVALARALVTEPRALLLDEPLAALDRQTRSLIISDLRRWNQRYRIPILLVTHSGEEVFALGEEVIVLEAGKIVAQGRPKDVMHAPRLETVAQLSGFENIFEATVAAVHEDRGTMTCRLGAGPVELETPLIRADVGAHLRVGIQAGDILLATEMPRGLSARNVVLGVIQQLERAEGMIAATVDCSGARFEINLTFAARDALGLTPGKPVWAVIKTHSCHLLSE